MEKFRYFRNLIASKLIVSDENKKQVVKNLCKIIFGDESKVLIYLRPNYNYFFIGEDSLKISQNPDAFKNSHYKEISVEDVLNPKLEKAFTEEELLEAVEINGCWIKDKFNSDKFLIVGISGSFVTIIDHEIKHISVDKLVNYYQFLNGEPCGSPITLEEIL